MPAVVEPKVKPTVIFEPVDRVYKFDGTAIKRALKTVGASQSQLSELCQFRGAAHVCRLLNSTESKVHGSSLKVIVKALKELGVKVDGFECDLN